MTGPSQPANDTGPSQPETGARGREQQRGTKDRRALHRWLVHLGLIASLAVSLFFEPFVLVAHIAVGLVFAALVGLHLGQRRRVSVSLASRLLQVSAWRRPAGRLALADAFLAAVTAVMLVSGFWDWFAGHPTRIRWHALTGIALTVLLVVHTARRWRRLRRSSVR
jgi:hypothetical protein